jgi:hypothetical protein
MLIRSNRDVCRANRENSPRFLQYLVLLANEQPGVLMVQKRVKGSSHVFE